MKRLGHGLMVLLASSVAVWLGSGCTSLSLNSEANIGETVLPDTELCKIGQIQHDGRYVALITQACAVNDDSVGLKTAKFKETLLLMGAHPDDIGYVE